MPARHTRRQRPAPRHSPDRAGHRRQDAATKIITVSLPEDLLRRLDQAARSAYLSRSAFLRDLTRRYLAEQAFGAPLAARKAAPRP